MPLVKKNITLAAGATSAQILQGTTYEYVDPGTNIIVAAAESTGHTAAMSSWISQLTMRNLQKTLLSVPKLRAKRSGGITQVTL